MTTQTDRELLELAAKAAGIDLSSGVDEHGAYEENWNPLTDDGDSLRLAVKLNLEITIKDYGTAARQGDAGEWSSEKNRRDKEAATRRAIVRAAAAIGAASTHGVTHTLTA